MNSYSVLEPTLEDILSVINPLREDWETRLRIINDVQKVVGYVESFRVVEPFGSFVSNLFSRWGDLDISIELSNGSCISSTGKKRKQSLLGDLLKALRQRGEFRRLQHIPHARVPILKIVSNRQNISCDVSIDNLCGQMKSKFLFWISEMDGRFRDMVFLVKEWAKDHDINNPRSGTLNSYSLSLLVIFIFSFNAGTRASAGSQIAEKCAANIARFRSDKYRTNNRSSLAQLFVSFFEKFCGISLKASELGICPFTGQWEHIRSNTKWLPNNHPIFIEDPFEQPENTARAVSEKQLAKISKTIEMTHSRLIVSGNESRCHFLYTLASPQTTHFITGTPVRYPNYNGGHFRALPLHSPSQARHQPHSLRLQNRFNGFMSQRPVQHYHNQPIRPHQSLVQQRWGPKSDALDSSSANEEAEA